MRSPDGRMACCAATCLQQSSSVAHTRKLKEWIVHLGSPLASELVAHVSKAEG